MYLPPLFIYSNCTRQNRNNPREYVRRTYDGGKKVFF